MSKVSHTSAEAIKVLIPVADGSEDIETVTVIDTLVRAGASVILASISHQLQVTCLCGTKLEADKYINECLGESWNMIVCPGGPGTQQLSDSATLIELLKTQMQAGRFVAGICGAPAKIFAKHGLLRGKRATCYPSMMEELGKSYTGSKVEICENLITSQGPGTALAFSLELVEALFSKTKANQVAKSMLIHHK